MRFAKIAVLGVVAGLTVSGAASADVPPSPPCPPGYVQTSADTCAQPFICPNGWRLAAGPKCVPWTCSKTDACDMKHKCVGASLCIDAKGVATQFCDDQRPCPAAQTCKPRDVCARGGGSGLGSIGAARGPFENWDAAAALAPKPSATVSAVAPSASAPTATAAPSASVTPAPSAQPAVPRKACAVAPGTTKPSALGLAWPFLALLLCLRRRRHP